MRSISLRLAALLLPLFLVACGDLPTNSPTPDPVSLSGAGPLLDCYWVSPGVAHCSDEEPIWDPVCDPYHYDCGPDDCIQSAGGGDIESTSTQGCPPPAGGGGTGGSAPGPGGGSGGTGSTTPPPPDDGICTADEYGTVCESEDRPECERRPDAPAECVTRLPSTTEWAALGQIVARMTENTDYCRGAKALAQEMYAAGREGGRIVLWDGRNYKPGTNQREMTWGRNDSDYRGRIIEMDSYLAFAVPSLLAHEALHAYLNSINWPGTPDEQDAWIEARESECAG